MNKVTQEEQQQLSLREACFSDAGRAALALTLTWFGGDEQRWIATVHCNNALVNDQPCCADQTVGSTHIEPVDSDKAELLAEEWLEGMAVASQMTIEAVGEVAASNPLSDVCRVLTFTAIRTA